ncbi:methylosome protein 50-like isoform X1 [Homarus americanus]|nr:methylosome protein 50-like isoform X1 [Homarus americanus]
MANSTEREDHEMDINSPEQAAEMQDVAVSPTMVNRLDTTPCQVDKHLDFVVVNKNGHLLMGSSNLNGRYWGGSLWYYDDAALAPNVEKCLVGYEVGSGVADGVFLDDEKTILIGQDCGSVEFLKISTEENETMMLSVCRVEEHLDAITCVKVTCNRKTALTGSADMSVRTWDCETSVVSRLLSPAHSQQVTGVSPHPSNDQLFLSSGMDGNVLLWDLRCQKPASCVYRDWDDKPECITWISNGNPGSSGEDHFLIGLQSGNVALRCTTNLNHSINTFQAFNRPLYRLMANPTRPSQVAVCANDSKVVVIDIENEEIKHRYEDDRHSDFVRGLTWTDSTSLVTCGWDKSVYIHQL